MTSVGAYEAKTHLPELLERVRKGERIMITKHGHPVAELVPPGSGDARKSVREAIDRLRTFREKHGIKTMSTKEILELIREGRRF
jgi:prevent-host-death family protein